MMCISVGDVGRWSLLFAGCVVAFLSVWGGGVKKNESLMLKVGWLASLWVREFMLLVVCCYFIYWLVGCLVVVMLRCLPVLLVLGILLLLFRSVACYVFAMLLCMITRLGVEIDTYRTCIYVLGEIKSPKKMLRFDPEWRNVCIYQYVAIYSNI